MPKYTFTDNGTWNVGIDAQHDPGSRVLVWPDSEDDEGDFGGGALQVFTVIEGVETPVADARADADSVDGNDDQLQQLLFVSSGNILVKLTGATDPNLTVACK